MGLPRIKGSIDQIPPTSDLVQTIRRVNEINAQLWDKSAKLEQDVTALAKKNSDLELLIRKVQAQ